MIRSACPVISKVLYSVQTSNGSLGVVMVRIAEEVCMLLEVCDGKNLLYHSYPLVMSDQILIIIKPNQKYIITSIPRHNTAS